VHENSIRMWAKWALITADAELKRFTDKVDLSIAETASTA
jgi:hypothetical protein